MRRGGLPIDYALLNLGRRPLRTAVSGLAAALIAGVLVLAVAFVRSLEDSFTGTGRADTAIVMAASAEGDVIRSAIAASTPSVVAGNVPGIVETGGRALVSGEIHIALEVRLPGPGGRRGPPRSAFLRGVTPAAYSVHEAMTLTRGRLPRSREVVVGRLAAGRLGVDPALLEPGRSLFVEGERFEIAGSFAAPGTTMEAEIWAPLEDLMAVLRRTDISAVFAKLESPEVIEDLQVFTNRRLDLELQAVSASEYYSGLAEYLSPVSRMVGLMALIIGGALLMSGTNTLNATVLERRQELATLRALGFSRGGLVRSLMLEAMLLMASGGLVGLLAARLAAEGLAFRIAMSAFALEVDGPCVLAAVAGVLLVGILGALPAAWKVARLPVAAAIKDDA